MDFERSLDALRHRWWLVVICVVLAGAAAYEFSHRLTPVYQAQATMLLNVAPQPLPTYQDVTASQALTKTYARIVSAQPTLDEAARRLGGNVSAAQISGVKGSDVPQTELILVTFNSSNPAFAAKVVNAVAQVTADSVKAIQVGDGSGDSSSGSPNPAALNSLRMMESAAVPTAPISPNVKLDAALGAFSGLVIGFLMALLLEHFDHTIRDANDLATLELVTLGAVRNLPRRRGKRVTVFDHGPSADALLESMRQLRTNLEFTGLGGKLKSLVVTSALPSEGKTTTACNLAVMLGNAGRRVILVDGNLRNPSVHTFFGLPNDRGFSTAVGAGLNVASLLKRTSVTNVQVLAGGPVPPNASELLASWNLRESMTLLESCADIVIYDSPPANSVADAAILTSYVDAVLFVVRAGSTRLEAVQMALDELNRSQKSIVGAVLNQVDSGQSAARVPFGRDLAARWLNGTNGTNGTNELQRIGAHDVHRNGSAERAVALRGDDNTED